MMRMHLILMLFLALAGLAFAGAEDTPANDVLMLRLRDGSIRWGKVAAHDAEGITFERLENGGLVRLPWRLLDPREELDLRQRFGYVDAGGEELLVSADRIVTVEGQEIIGLIVDRTADLILLKTATATLPLAKNRIASAPTTVQVPATEIFTKEELYTRELANTDLTKAQGHFGVAQFCERILDFARAAEHYKKAQALDPAYRTDDVKVALQRTLEGAAKQGEIDYLSDVDNLIARRRFDEAIAKADSFKDKFAQSPLLADAKKRIDRAVKARERYLLEAVATLWNRRVGDAARTASVKMTFEQALAYLDGQMRDDVLQAVTKDVQKISKQATPDDVKKLWAKRQKVRWNKASYGLGTWLLGKDQAMKTGDKGDDKEKQAVNAKDQERLALEKRITAFMKTQEMTRAAKTTDEVKDEREVAWSELPGVARAGWILAYYVENAGDYEVRPDAIFLACRECGGEGVRSMAIVGANVATDARGKQMTDLIMQCPTCHGLGVTRKIAYR